MADTFLTLKDLAAREGTDDVVGLIEDVVNVAPEIDRIQGRVIRGISYSARVRKAIHSGVAFRRVNAGVPLGASSYDKRRFNCFFFDGQMRVDEAEVIAAETEGDSMGKLFMEEGQGVMRAKAIDLGKQFYLGTVNDAEGCPGLTDFMVTQASEIDSRTGSAIDQVIDAPTFFGGTASSQTTYETAWFCHVGPQGVHWLFGGGRGLILNPWTRQQVADANLKKYFAYVSNLSGYVGTSCANVHAVGAIKDIDNTVVSTPGATPNAVWLTDGMIASLWAKFPIGLKPNICFASQKVIRGLQLSRSVTLFANADRGGASNSGGAAPIAPWPTELPTAGGIPIVPTDSITPAAKVTVF